jgi:hypothetical protein
VLVTGAAVALLRSREQYKLSLVEASVKVRGKDDSIDLYEVDATTS